jgi:hypothetical protein
MSESTTEDESNPIGTRTRVPSRDDGDDPIVTQTRAP